MMKSNRNLYFMLCMALVIAAQQIYSEQESKDVELTIRLASYGEPLAGIYWYTNSQDVLLPLSPHRLSRWLDYHGPSKLNLYKIHEQENGNIKREIVAQVDLSDLDEAAFLILFPNSRMENERYNIAAIEASRSVFGQNQTRIQNLTNETLSGFIGDVFFSLNPGDHGFIGYPEGREARIVLLYRLATRQDDGWELLMDSEMVFRSNSRRLMFFTPSGRDGATRTWVLDER